MKKKAVGIILMTVMLSSLAGCGTKATSVQATSANNVSEVSVITENTATPIESATIEETSSISESNAVEPIYIDYGDVVMVDNYEELNYENLGDVDWDNMEDMCVEGILLPESIDVYDELGDWIGYSKPNVEVTLLGQNDKWVEISFISKLSFVPRDVFESVAGIEAKETVTEEVSPKDETPVTETPAPVVETPASVLTPATTTTVEPETVVVESTKYTPEEAVAVYRSIMEANGIQWDPSIKDFASWGTGWINLEKGQPERTGNSNVEAYRRGGGDATRPWTRYYVEVTSSDANAVYITQWHCR